MKILICANQDLYANILLNHLLPAIREHDISILFSTRIGGAKKRAPLLDYLKFYEQDLPNQFLFPHRETQDGDSAFKTFNQLSAQFNIPMQAVNNINQPEGLALVEGFAPDLIVSVRFGQILKDAVIQTPRLGVINLHSGLLPQYRGVLATFWSLLYGQGEYGYTLHRITDSGIDTGEIIERRVLQTDPQKSLFCHIHSIYPLAAGSIAQAITTLVNGETLTTQPQPETQGAYYTYPETEHFDQLLAKGYSLLDREAYFQVLRDYTQPQDFSSDKRFHILYHGVRAEGAELAVYEAGSP